MSNTVSTITTKWQVTIPEEIRRELPFKVGQRIAWAVQGDKIVGRRVRSVSELSGCLKSGVVASDKTDSSGGFAGAAIARHERISRQKS
jgi:bifunctional DNA-binding transcriptional regulator/antitoxin component of YhaV-PrlF toxin-antitoxin module